MSKYNDDGLLVKRILDGDINLFGELINRYQDVVYGMVYSKIRSFTDAQDIAQIIFIHAYQKLDQLNNHENFLAWLKAITANECSEWLRQRKPTTTLDDSELQTLFISQAMIDRREQEFHSDIMQSVAALPDDRWAVFTLHHLLGMSYEQISGLLSIPISTIVGRLHRARTQLRSYQVRNPEETIVKRRLPDTFAHEVLKRLTLNPIEVGYTCAMVSDDEGILALGIHSRRSHMLLLAMSREEIDAIVCHRAIVHVANPKSQTLMAMKDAMDSFNINLNEVILHLGEKSSCKARMVITHGKIEKSLCLRVSDALFLAYTTGIPVLAEDDLVGKGLIRADEKTYNLLCDARYFRSEFSVVNQRARIEIAAFKAAPMASRGRHSVRCRAGLVSDSLDLWVLDTDITVRLDLKDHLLGFENLFQISDGDGSYSRMEGDDGCLHTVNYTIRDGEIVIAFNPQPSIAK